MSTENSKTESYETLQVGDKVKHPKFGDGQILRRSGSGKETKLLVAFAEEGEKQLLAQYAHLKKTHPIGEEEGKTAEAKPKPEEKIVLKEPRLPQVEVEEEAEEEIKEDIEEGEIEEGLEEEGEADEDFEIAEADDEEEDDLETEKDVDE